jgi:NADPH:quinone reductase-like Zn-dependent oxidoreductase
VQVAEACGADVTGVCSTKSLELVHSIGANRVIDYSQEDFRESAERMRGHPRQRRGPVDGGYQTRTHTARDAVLSHGGGLSAGRLGCVIRVSLVSLIVCQQGRPSVKAQNRSDLVALKELVEACW